MTTEELSQQFKAMDDLRDSGENTYGGPRYLQEQFGTERFEAREVVSAWMHTFNPDLTPYNRAEIAIKEGHWS